MSRWNNYLKIPAFMSVSREAVNKILLSYPRCKVLDVGSGYGRISLFLQNNNFNVTAIDNDPKMVEMCNSSGIDCHKMDVRNMVFKDNSFDGVITDGLLEHFVNPVPIIREEYRVAKKWVLNFVPTDTVINAVLEKVQRVPREYRKSKEEWEGFHQGIFPCVEIIELSRLLAIKSEKVA